MKKEYWKPVVGYEGLYEVSNWGRVKSLKFGKERILKPCTNRYGYLFVKLCKDGKVKPFTVHRLVAEAFLPNPDNLPQVNHKDENKQNNIVSNLEWCSAQYNNTYGTRIERVAEKTTNGKCSKTVLQYTLEGNFIKEWKSVAECRRNGFRHVDDVCRGERKSCGGYIWEYKNEED